jgi:phage tail-like protein
MTRDVYASNRFWVEIQGITEATFSECSALQAETEMLKLEEGGLNGYVHQLPGRTTFSNLTLKRGVATSALWDWHYSVTQGRITRRDLSIVTLGYVNNGQSKSIRWNISGALPVKWIGSALRSDSNEVVVETIELAHWGFRRA